MQRLASKQPQWISPFSSDALKTHSWLVMHPVDTWTICICICINMYIYISICIYYAVLSTQCENSAKHSPPVTRALLLCTAVAHSFSFLFMPNWHKYSSAELEKGAESSTTLVANILKRHCQMQKKFQLPNSKEKNWNEFDRLECPCARTTEQVFAGFPAFTKNENTGTE